MQGEEAREMPRPDAETLSKLGDRTSIERPGLDQSQSALDGGLRALPGGTEGRRLGAAPQARAEPRMFCSGGTSEEPDVARERRSRRTNRPAVDACRLDRDEDDTIPSWIAVAEGFVLGLEIEHRPE